MQTEPLGYVPIGTRVRLTTVPLRHGAGLVDVPATLVRLESLDLSDFGMGVSETPVFHTDAGREVRGYECWWTLADNPAAP